MVKRRLPFNWRSRIEIVEEEECEFSGHKIRYVETRYVLTFIKGKTPKGFLTRIGDILVCVKDGEIEVEPEINEWAKGRGLGKMLYEHVLNKHGSISTIYHEASPEARMVWDSLCRRFPFKTDFFSGKLKIMNR